MRRIDGDEIGVFKYVFDRHGRRQTRDCSNFAETFIVSQTALGYRNKTLKELNCSSNSSVYYTRIGFDGFS